MVSHNGHAHYNGALAPSKPTRNSAYRHAQSIGRQRAQADVSPEHRAKCAAAFIRKAMAEGQPIDLAPHGLDDATWSELVAILSPEELAAVNAAGQSDYEPASAPTPELPGWRNREPRFVHSLKWFDTDRIEHLHVVRSDDLDDVLRGISRVRASIKATRARDKKRASVPTEALPQALAREPEQVSAADYLTVHQLAERLPAFTIWQMRKLLERREQNGLNQYVRKVGKRLYIRERGFDEWLDQQSDEREDRNYEPYTTTTRRRARRTL
jgi:hypothetical protein